LSFDDKKVQDIVKYALLSVDEQEGSIKTHMLSKIINASKQVNSNFTYLEFKNYLFFLNEFNLCV